MTHSMAVRVHTSCSSVLMSRGTAGRRPTLQANCGRAPSQCERPSACGCLNGSSMKQHQQQYQQHQYLRYFLSNPRVRPTKLASARVAAVKVSAALATPPLRGSRTETQGLVKMARMQNVAPSAILVLLGAWAGAARRLEDLLRCPATVFATATISAVVAAASMIINDYFDFMSGTDVVNCPEKPLPSGQVSPDSAVLTASFLYVAALTTVCMLEGTALRLTLALAAGVTLIYTPLLKRTPLVKNLAVATIISLATVSGALAVSPDLDSLLRVLPCAAFAFCCMVFREIIMDVADVEGDAATAVYTLPVLMGCTPALMVGCCAVVLGSGLVLQLISQRTMLVTALSGSLLQAPAFLNASTAGLAVVASTALLLWQAWVVVRADFRAEEVSKAIKACNLPIGVALVALAVAG